MTHPITPILPYPDLATPLAKHDVTALNGLSDVSQVRAWTRRKVARYKKHITALLAIHNSIAPINKLPTEILQQVFVHVPSRSRKCSPSWMVSLQFVCRRWRSVLLATPKFWLEGLHVILKTNPRVRAPFTPELEVDTCGDGDKDEDEDCDSEDEDDEDDEEEELTSYSNPRGLFLARSAPCPLELGELQTSSRRRRGWELFQDHFDRVTAFEIEVRDEEELYDVLHPITKGMKHLEKLDLFIERESDMYPGDDLALTQWQAEDLPRLVQLEMTGPLFSRATTVPSLQKIGLYGGRDIATLPALLDALEGCPALISIYLEFHTWHLSQRMNGGQLQIPHRVVDLPNLRALEICADIPELSSFLSCLSFPPTALIDVDVDGDIGDQFTLPSILPRRLSRMHTSPTIDRLYIHSSDSPYRSNPPSPYMSIIGSVQGAPRLKVDPAFRLSKAENFFQFLEDFASCTVTELALDVGPLPSDVDDEFWREFFAALPDVRRLELLSRSTQSIATKRVIAEHFLASVRNGQQTAGETSLAWVLRAEGSDTSHLEEELYEVEQVLLNHAHLGGRLESLELYITTSGPEDIYWAKFSSVTRITTDEVASRLVTKDYVSRLAGAADMVIIGGGWAPAEDNGHDTKDRSRMQVV